MGIPNQTPDYYAHPSPDVNQGQGVGPEIIIDSTPSLPPSPFPLLINMPVNGVYTGYGITVTYSFDDGLRWSPVAGPLPDGSNDAQTRCVFWRCHSGVCIKRVDWVAQMMITRPPVPLPLTNDNEVLIFKHLEVPHREVNQDGNYVWTLAGSYFFALQTMPADSDTLYGAVIPLDTGDVADVTLDPSDYVTDLIGPTVPPSGFAGGPINY